MRPSQLLLLSPEAVVLKCTVELRVCKAPSKEEGMLVMESHDTILQMSWLAQVAIVPRRGAADLQASWLLLPDQRRNRPWPSACFSHSQAVKRVSYPKLRATFVRCGVRLRDCRDCSLTFCFLRTNHHAMCIQPSCHVYCSLQLYKARMGDLSISRFEGINFLFRFSFRVALAPSASCTASETFPHGGLFYVLKQ